MSNNNPFLSPFGTLFNVVPFDKIEIDHFIPAINQAIEEARKEIEVIVEQRAAPTFENTIAQLENSGELLGTITSVLFNLNSAETTDELQAIAQEASPLLTNFDNEIKQNTQLFDRIKKIYGGDEKVDNEQQMLLDKTYKSFVRSGAGLNSSDQLKFKEITVELSKLSLKFGENVLSETNSYELIVSDVKDLTGLPEDVIARAADLATQKELKDKWAFTLQAPSYIPFMENADNRSLREQLYRAYMQKAFKGDEFDNQELVTKIVRLRAQMAQLLGYRTFADYVLEERMATKAGTVYDFLDDLLTKSKTKALDEMDELKQFMQGLGVNHDLQRWDWAYYSEKLRKEKFDLDDELIKPYFKLENVIEGVFRTAEKLYGLTFKENSDIPVYHEDVKTYEVFDHGDLKAIFLADYFPRKGKRPGAWMTSYRDEKKTNSVRRIPVISIVCNFTPSSTNSPSLLKFDEVKTLFHEFGHALHGMLADTTYASLSGTSVFWDFVELPSQIFENWCFEGECLELFAHHHKTGELIPTAYIQRLKASSAYHEAYATMRQISFGLLDMSYHDKAAGELEKLSSISEFEKNAMKSTEMFPLVENTNMSVQFAHIFAGGYGAGYYSYKWAEVLDADAFELFKQKGIFDPKTAASFKENVLSKGGTAPPMELYEAFRGKKPTVDALLKRAGLLD